MKVARFYAPGDVRLEDMDEPTPGPDEVKIRVRNCSTCGTDVKIFNNGHPNTLIVRARTRPLHPERRLHPEAPFDISEHDSGGFV